MSQSYRLVQWNAYKRRYDLVLIGGVVTYLAGFFVSGKLIWRGQHGISDEILAIRALGTCAFALLNVTLSIGPLARLDRGFLPVLYNRRHLGVTTFLVALAHGVLVFGFYHGFGVVDPLRSLLTSNAQYRSITAFPFEIFGVLALLILFLMAATSHDFWLRNLSPRVWKSLHMLVYVAWAALVLHVALGAMQAERSVVYTIAMFAWALWIPSIHWIVGRREVRRDGVEAEKGGDAGWVDVGDVDDIIDRRGKVVCLPGRERVAVFRDGETFCAVGNVCAHQGGPVGEGKIIDGCITCPWHGYQYRPSDGRSPPPFTEKLPTYRLRVIDRRILLNPNPLPPGTHVEPAREELPTKRGFDEPAALTAAAAR
jgi:sulfoxide reductase heme-binding subunit YedZ